MERRGYDEKGVRVNIGVLKTRDRDRGLGGSAFRLKLYRNLWWNVCKTLFHYELVAAGHESRVSQFQSWRATKDWSLELVSIAHYVAL